MLHFNRAVKKAHMLDPRKDFTEVCIESEVRFDPLTRNTARVCHFVGMRPDRNEAIILADKSRELFCPFCPENVMKVTPKFPKHVIPEERLVQGEAVLFPNLMPYDSHSSVAAITREHFVPLLQFQEKQLVDVLQLAVTYFQHLQSKSDDPYCLINWNYMPPAGASQVHPHMQVFATGTAGNTHREEIEASRRFYESHTLNYWKVLVEEEEALGKRWVGTTGRISWLVSFAPFGIMGDIIAVFPDCPSIGEISTTDWGDFACGLVTLFRYFDSKEITSFNLAFYPGLPRQQDFWTHVRISPRVSSQPKLNTSDIGTLYHLYHEPFTLVWPEEFAREIRSFFK